MSFNLTQPSVAQHIAPLLLVKIHLVVHYKNEGCCSDMGKVHHYIQKREQIFLLFSRVCAFGYFAFHLSSCLRFSSLISSLHCLTC